MKSTQLVDRTAELFDVSPAALLGTNRTQRVAYARFALAWALRQSDWTLQDIGALLGRNHTTVIYAIDAAEARASKDLVYAERLASLAPDRPAFQHARRRHSKVAQLEAERDEWKKTAEQYRVAGMRWMKEAERLQNELNALRATLEARMNIQDEIDRLAVAARVANERAALRAGEGEGVL